MGTHYVPSNMKSFLQDRQFNEVGLLQVKHILEQSLQLETSKYYPSKQVEHLSNPAPIQVLQERWHISYCVVLKTLELSKTVE